MSSGVLGIGVIRPTAPPEQSKEVEEMAPRDEALIELTKEIRELKATPKSNGEWKIDIMKFIALLVTLAGAFYWVGSTTTESKITQAILIDQVKQLREQMEKSDKLHKENQYDLKSKNDALQSRVEMLERRRR